MTQPPSIDVDAGVQAPLAFEIARLGIANGRHSRAEGTKERDTV
jgi:hypothetical protein